VVVSVAVVLAGGVGAAGAAPPTTGTVFHQVDLKSNSIVTVTVTCPPGYVAVSGGLSVGNLMVTGPSGPVLSSLRSGPGAWTLRLGNPVTSPDQLVVLAVRCTRIRLKLVVVPSGGVRKIVLKQVGMTKSTTVAPGQGGSVKASCPSGSDLTGLGYDEQPATGGKAVLATTPVSIPPIHPFAEAVMSNKAGWAIGANVQFDYPPPPTSTAVPARATVQATCIKTHYALRVGSHRYASSFHTFDRAAELAVPPLQQVNAALGCPNSSAYVGSDFLAAPQFRVLAGPQEPGGRAAFSFYNPSSIEGTAAPSALCAVTKYTG
jgi:hypothetical protein